MGDERGVSVILGAILLLMILVLTGPILYRQYAESTITDKEEKQMSNVRERFLELKSIVSSVNGPENSGEVEIPMSAGSVALFPGQSPAGTLTITKGQKVVEQPEDPTKITIRPGSIKFTGRNLFYPYQTYIYQAGHVILQQDETNFMISKNEDLLTYDNNEDNLEIKYPLINKERSVSSTGSETITLSWGGKNRHPKNKELKNSEGIRLELKTEYKKTWQNYLQQKDDNITEINFEVGNITDGVYMQNGTKNITYYVSSTDIGGQVTNPTVKTENYGEIWSDAAILNMSYNFKDYAEGETRFQFREADNGTWSSTGWETQYGEDSNYTRLIRGLASDTPYLYRAQIRYNSQTKSGNISSFTTDPPGNSIGGGDDGGDDGTLNPGPNEGGLYLQKVESPNNDETILTFNNTSSYNITITESRVGFYVRPGSQDKAPEQWDSDITDENTGPYNIGGDFILGSKKFEPSTKDDVTISFSEKTKSSDWYMYQIILDSGARYTYFVIVP